MVTSTRGTDRSAHRGLLRLVRRVGIQADLRTLAALRMHAASVVTAVVSRNTRGTADVYAQPTTVVSAQLASVLDDLPVAAQMRRAARGSW